MKLIVLLLALLYSTFVFSNDSLKSVVLDSETLKPIGYVSITIPNLNIGTISNENGEFSISYSNNNSDSLYVSMIGYLPQVFCITNGQVPSEIHLKQRSFDLEMVSISPIYVNKKQIGHKYPKRGIQVGLGATNKSSELGVVFKLEKKSLLSRISFNTSKCTYKQINFRVNIYEQIDKFSFENILETPIYIEHTFNDSIVTTPLEIDISEYNIIAKGKILITLEYISDLGPGDLLFYGYSVKGLPSYYRESSTAPWRKAPKQVSAQLQFYVED